MNKRYAPSFLCLVALLIADLLAPNGLVAQPSSSPREDFWITDGPVKAILVTNGIAYIGGTFGNVGPRRSFGAVLDCQTGEADPDFPKVLGIPGVAYPDTGVISAVAPDGNGGWFIGGTFTNLGGVQRNGLAHMLSDGTIDPAWNPAPEFIPDFTDNGPVLALLAWQNRVYVAGRFILIGGLPRNNLAALDAVDGEAVDWDPSPNDLVLAVAVGGDKLYVGGTFTSLASQNRNRIAAFDLQTGNLTSWNPSASSTVSAIAASGTNVYVGGYFATIGGRSRPYLAALSKETRSSLEGISSE